MVATELNSEIGEATIERRVNGPESALALFERVTDKAALAVAEAKAHESVDELKAAQASALGNFGTCLAQCGELNRAVEPLELALELRRAAAMRPGATASARRSLGVATANLGAALMNGDEAQQARSQPLMEIAAKIAKREGDTVTQRMLLTNISNHGESDGEARVGFRRAVAARARQRPRRRACALSAPADFEPDSRIAVLGCAHAYCADCGRWRRPSEKCPECHYRRIRSEPASHAAGR